MTNAPALLLDSNVVVWLDQKPERLSDIVRQRIESAPLVFLSAVTAWELSIKQSLGALTLARPVSDLLGAHALTELPVTIRHGEAVRNLPLYHRDPFDRLLVAQATVEGLILVSGDRLLLRYGIPILRV
jgi:PIN domain nuclease of toxin-antitoxin system